MILCLDVGNSHIFGGVFVDDEIRLRFRHTSKQESTSDQLGVFLKTVLRENNIHTEEIAHIAICSVVPGLDYSLRAACRKYFNLLPFVLQAGVKTGLQIKYRNPLEVGADRIANAIAATNIYPNQNLIVIDLGTATTFCAISNQKEYLGGVILPGMRISMEALQKNTAKLPPVEILEPVSMVGRSTIESIQSGLYWGQLGAIKEITRGVIQHAFKNHPPLIIGTGGFAHLFEHEKIFHHIHPDLVLYGLQTALKLNVN